MNADFSTAACVHAASATRKETTSVTQKEIPPDPDIIVPNDEPSKAFVRGLVERGEAVAPTRSGKLPPRATHIIIGRTGEGLPIVKRMRFNAF